MIDVQQQQVAQVPNTTAQVTQVPATPGPFTAGNVQNPQGAVRYIRIPAGVTKATYNLKPAPLNNVTTVHTPAMATATPVTAGRGQSKGPSKSPSKTGAAHSRKCSYP